MALLENDIRIGSITAPTHRYSNRTLEMGSAVSENMVDIIGNELSIDNFSVIVRYATSKAIIYAPLNKEGYLTSDNKVYGVGMVFTSIYAPWGKDGYKTSDNKVYKLADGELKDYLTELAFGVPIWWYCDNGFFVKGYIKSVERVGKYAWKINCVSGIGLLEEKMHVGGLYTGQTVGTLVSDIIGSSFNYSVSNDVSNISAFGHLPYDTARNNLHRVLFSCGAIVKRGTQSTDYVIDFADTTPTTVPTSRIAMGGSVDFQLPSNTVEVTEHSYFKTPVDTTVTVFDNSNSVFAEHQLVTFKDAPVYDLVASAGLTVHESNVNYAIVSGYGTLTGKKYSHVTNIVRLSDKTENEPERIKRVENNELVSSVNSNNVARRVLNYYKSAKTVRAKIMLQNEGCGAMVSTIDAFGDSTTAIIKKMSVRPTSVKGADCELVDGYTPGNNGNNYANRAFISASGTWTVPSGVDRIRIVLIGGGQGGTGGSSGEAGKGGNSSTGGDLIEQKSSSGGWDYQSFSYNNQGVSNGGVGGAGGVGGKTAIYDRNVTPGESITISVGVGGTGGTGGVGSSSTQSAAGYVGSDGTASTASSTNIGALTSENGLAGAGYYDAITGEVYGATGVTGISGGKGGKTDTISLDGYLGGNGLDGENVGDYAGGTGGNGHISNNPGDLLHEWVSGGGGGGAAYGANGGVGGNYVIDFFDLYGGNGGIGATAVAPSQASYGNGGNGGHGGGGGGNGAGGMIEESSPRSYTVYPGNGGNGGNGSTGGQGGNGCVIIYY